MSRFGKALFLSAVMLFFVSQARCAEENVALCDAVSPEIGWERYSGDSATSIKEWVSWWKYLRLKEPTVINWKHGFNMRIYPGNEVYRSIFVRGIYDPNLMVVIRSLLKEGSVFLDVGASMGYISLLASRVVGNSGSVFSLEPSSRDFERLKDNVALNDLGGVIFPRRLALSDKNGTAQLLVATEERSALNTLGSEISCKGVDNIGKESVETSTLDSFVESEKITRVDLIKLDIEGCEVKALRGAKKTIDKYRPVIILGINRDALKSCETNRDELAGLICEIGYCAYKIVEKPIFALEKVDFLANENAGVIICMHNDTSLPILPQPDVRSVVDKILDFVSR
ncbi:MAG: FkbM family methyltransferase [Holosporaceae bacterium]|jgi:FkbM family methyltransferase|nr:FkbM family methyltransferase [Holosporaceae bacterium]